MENQNLEVASSQSIIGSYRNAQLGTRVAYVGDVTVTANHQFSLVFRKLIHIETTQEKLNCYHYALRNALIAMKSVEI